MGHSVYDGQKESAHRQERGEKAHMCGGIGENARWFSIPLSFYHILCSTFLLFLLSLSFVRPYAYAHTHRLFSSLIFDPRLSRSANPGNLLCRDRASIDSWRESNVPPLMIMFWINHSIKWTVVRAHPLRVYVKPAERQALTNWHRPSAACMSHVVPPVWKQKGELCLPQISSSAL